MTISPQTTNDLEYLYRLERFEKIKPSLDNMTRLLTALDNPHQKFHSIHIAGTNGKGSTAAMLANILTHAGYRTGLYTSPHLTKFNERVQINHQAIDNASLSRHIQTIRSTVAAAKIKPTFFEFTTALAFSHFHTEQVDMAIIEVGMGGDLDATNVITPLLSIITNIGIDHQTWLGRTKTAIAKHKAGIIKPGIPLITAETNPSILSYLKQICHQNNSPFIPVHSHLQAKVTQTSISNQSFTVKTKTKNSPQYSSLSPPLAPIPTPGVGMPSPEPLRAFQTLRVRKRLTTPLDGPYDLSLLGQHQVTNAITALTAIHCLQPFLHPEGVKKVHIKEGLASVNWPGRLEIVSNHPLILVDGAHNQEGLLSLITFLNQNSLPPLHTLIIGTKLDKQINHQIKQLAFLFPHIIASQAKHRPTPAHQLANIIKSYHPDTQAIPSLTIAIETARKQVPINQTLVIAGSLYLIGDALTALKEKEPLLNTVA